MLKVTDLKQKIAEKENSEISKLRESPLVFSKNHLIAAGFKKLRSTGLTKDLRIWKQKILPKSSVFSVCLLRKIERKIFRATRRLQEHRKNAESFWETPTKGIFPGAKTRSKLSQKKKQLKKIAVCPRLPWPDHPSTTERTLISSWLLLEATQWASRSTIYFFS